MAYEVFKHGHIALALGWFCLMFWHVRNELVAVSLTVRDEIWKNNAYFDNSLHSSIRRLGLGAVLCLHASYTAIDSCTLSLTLQRDTPRRWNIFQET